VSAAALIDLWRTALTCVVEVGGPFVLAALAVGIVMSLLQAATQLSDGALSFVPKLAAVGLVLALMGPWLLGRLTHLTTTAAATVVEIGRGGAR
jgi:flagellar biosynthesis protein FliQ